MAKQSQHKGGKGTAGKVKPPPPAPPKGKTSSKK